MSEKTVTYTQSCRGGGKTVTMNGGILMSKDIDTKEAEIAALKRKLAVAERQTAIISERLNLLINTYSYFTTRIIETLIKTSKDQAEKEIPK